jgi:hypothetical protein
MGAEEGQNMGMLMAECEGVGGWIMMVGIETIIAACSELEFLVLLFGFCDFQSSVGMHIWHGTV